MLQSVKCDEQTNESFRAQTQTPRHHDGVSPFTELESIDMIKGFPLMIQIWKSKWKSNFIDEINLRINTLSKLMPSEFHRPGRPLTDLANWKATEFRLFLLYTGPVVLKGKLPDDMYDHFIVLHVCIRILCSPHSTQTAYLFAKEWLEYFTLRIGELYGELSMIYNLHSISHLADDFIHFNKLLDFFSTFPFETELRHLVDMITGMKNPLSQLVRLNKR